MASVQRLGDAAARRIALTAQGFAAASPEPGSRQIKGLLRRLSLFQIDSINILARAHLLPAYSRLGSYPTELVDQLATRRGAGFEYWGHAASVIDVNLEPALRFRYADYRNWRAAQEVLRDTPGIADEIQELLAAGPRTARELDAGPVTKHHWGWNWSKTKLILEWLLATGEVFSAGRTSAFERRYALRSAVLPTHILTSPGLDRDQAHLELTRRAAAALGIATLDSLADYFRTNKRETAAAVAGLERNQELIPVEVRGAGKQLWRWHRARAARDLSRVAFVSPFDPLIFHRDRANDLLGLDYRIEIYVPKAQRKYGYYALPLLAGDRFVARMDLAARRATGTLEIAGAWLEPEISTEQALAAAEVALPELADWLGLQRIEVQPVGDLADQLAKLY